QPAAVAAAGGSSPHVIEGERPPSPPASCQQPDGRWRRRTRDLQELALAWLVQPNRIAPAVEPVGARERIDPVAGELLAAPRFVLPVVEEDVTERVTRLARGPEDARVI